MRLYLVASSVLQCVSAGSVVTIQSADVKSFLEGKRVSKIVDNLKVSYDAELSLPAPLSKAKLSLLYDLKAKADFFKEATLTGAVEQVKYQIKHTVSSSVTALTLATQQAGVVFKAHGDSKDKFTGVAASKTIEAADGRLSVAVEPTYLASTNSAKLKLSPSFDIGGGVSASAQLVATQPSDIKAEYAIEYETSLGEDRKLSVSVSPADKEANLLLVDSKLEKSATWVGTASMGLTGGMPKVAFRRVQKF